MFTYEFIDVNLETSLSSGKTDTYDKCKSIITEKAKEGWELVQIVRVTNEKTGVGTLVKYSLVFKTNID